LRSSILLALLRTFMAKGIDLANGKPAAAKAEPAGKPPAEPSGSATRT
jgi:hypothetical protein